MCNNILIILNSKGDYGMGITQVKQFSSKYSRKAVENFLMYVQSSEYRNSRSFGSQEAFENTVLDGNSLDKIKGHYSHFQRLCKYLDIYEDVWEFEKKDVFDILFVLVKNNIKLRNIVTNIFVRYYNVDIVNHLNYLVEGISISDREFDIRVCSLYRALYGRDVHDDYSDYILGYLEQFKVVIRKYAKMLYIFSNNVFEDTCSVKKRIYITSVYSELVSRKYRSNGVDVDKSLKLYQEVLDMFIRDNFSRYKFEEYTDYIKGYTVNGVRVVSRDDTIYNFLVNMYIFSSILSRLDEFVLDVNSGMSFDELKGKYYLSYNSVDELIKDINNKLVLVRSRLCDGWENMLRDSVNSDFKSTYDYDADDIMSDTSVDEDVYDVEVKSNSYTGDELSSFVMKLLINRIDSNNYAEYIRVSDTWGFIQDLARLHNSVSSEDVQEAIEEFVRDIIFFGD